MPTQLSGYANNTSSKEMKEITITPIGTKTFSDSIALLNILDNVNENHASGYGPVYEGYAAPGTADDAAGWAIRKSTYDSNGGVLTSKWADGEYPKFDKVWDDRATYF